MKRTLVIFIMVFLLKGVALFLILRIGNTISINYNPLKFLVFYTLISLIDWKTFNRLSIILRRTIWIKLTSFAFGTYLFVPMITAYLFRINNYVFNVIVDKNTKMTPGLLIAFFITGLFFISLTTTIWIKIKNNHHKEIDGKRTSIRSAL